MDGRSALPQNIILGDSYRIERVIGSGGFGITYAAEDISLGTLVAIKEYYPEEFGDRDATMSVRPKTAKHQPTFEWGRTSFLQEARMLARFKHPCIVQVTRVFEANATAYMVMGLEQGPSFETWLKALDRPPTQDELDRIVSPLLDALAVMHAESFLHRDIAPDNIIVRADGSPVLLDFGAARRAVAEKSRTLTGIVKAGYSPHEQYATDSRLQGPWSDLYALGATLYRAVTGKPPEESTLRVTDDRMPSAAQAAKGAYRPAFLAAIDACLKVRPTERPQSVAQLRPLLLGAAPQPMSRPSRALRWRLAAAALVLAAGIYAGLEYARWQAEQSRRMESEATRQANAAAAKKEAEEAEAKRREDERVAAEKRALEEGLRKVAEAKRHADAAARKRAEEEARAKSQIESDTKQHGSASRQALIDCQMGANEDRTIRGCTQVINDRLQSARIRALAFHTRGFQYFKREDYDRAIGDFDEAIRLNSEDATFHNNRGNAFYQKGEYHLAIPNFDQAIRLDPNYTSAFAARGMSRESLGQRELAIEDYLGALAVPPKYSDGEWAHDKARERLGILTKLPLTRPSLPIVPKMR